MTETDAPRANTDGLVTVRDGAVLRLTVDRPATLNSLTVPLLRALTDEVRAASVDPDVRVIVLTGTGRAFSSGASLDTSGSSDELVGTLDEGNKLVSAIVAAPKPVVAAVNGLAAGIGATVALSCDLVVARRSAYFLLAFVNIGLLPDGGATAIVPAAIGRARAARMAMLGERIAADTAFDWGLVSHVVDDDAFDGDVADLVASLAAAPTQAIARTKAALAASTLAALQASHTVERAGQLELFDTADFTEGVRAFHEKRPAVFRGR